MLRHFFKSFYNLPDEDFLLFSEKLKAQSFRKGETITNIGDIQKRLYFVKQGVQMSYFENDRKLHVVAFTYAPGLCAVPDSFSMQTPSNYKLVCIADSEMEYITYQDLQQLFDASQNIERLFRKMTEAVLAGVIQRHTELHSLTIEERFKAFCNRSGHLLQLVPHKYIASYLGIDATNFSKLYNSVKIQ